MSKSNDDLGGRIRLLKPADLSASQRRLYKVIGETAVPWANKAGFSGTIG